MEIKILQVFYGSDGLPYKDQERTVHFPIVGSGFQGASNTTKIRFYFQEIGNINVSYVAVSKLPNGKIGSKVLTTAYDSEVGEYYAEMTLDSYYFQYKGDVFISLQGYQGDIEVTYDDQEEIYEIKGTPTIKATGSIKMSVNYAPQFVGSGEEDNATLEDILSLVGTKADANKVVNRLTFDATGKTVADLFTFITQNNIITVPSVILLQINGITNSGAYMVLLAKTTGLDQYYLEFERYASGVRAAQDRWVAAGISGSTTIEELLTTYNDYYAPYLVNGNRINYDTATMEQLHNAIGNVPHIIGLYGDSAFANVYGGYFLIKFSEDSQSNLNFTALRISNHAQGYTDFYYGANIPTSTLVSAVFNHSTSYYKPLVTKPQLDSGLATKQDVLTFDNEPTAGSNNPVTSKGIKSYVDDLVASIEQDELQEVNTTTYPTLQSFLASTGKEGIIYLYPVDAQDLTKGYHKYTWETDHYIYLGDTNIDLSNYLTKTEAIADYVSKTYFKNNGIIRLPEMLDNQNIANYVTMNEVQTGIIYLAKHHGEDYLVRFYGQSVLVLSLYGANNYRLNYTSTSTFADVFTSSASYSNLSVYPIDTNTTISTMTSGQTRNSPIIFYFTNAFNNSIFIGQFRKRSEVGGSDNVDYEIESLNDGRRWSGTDINPTTKIYSLMIDANRNDYALENEVVSKYSVDSTQWDTTPTQNSTKPVTSGGVYNEISSVREVAEGKCKTYVLSYNDTVTDIKALLGEYTKICDINGNDITQEWIDGEYDNVVLGNAAFNSQNADIFAIYPPSGAVFRYPVGYNAFTFLYVAYEETTIFNVGDIFLVIETEVPDRWYGGSYKYYKLETTKVDLNNYVTLDTTQIITALKNFSSGLTVGTSEQDDAGSITFLNTPMNNEGDWKLHSPSQSYVYLEQLTQGTGFEFGRGSFRPHTNNYFNLGINGKSWKDLYLSGSLYGTTYSGTVDQLCSQFNPTDAGTTIIKWSQMLLFTLSADTTFTFESAKSGCLNEYKAIITNSGSSAITITLPASINIETNDDSITISSNTFVLPSGTTVELNCVNLWCIVYNHNAQ